MASRRILVIESEDDFAQSLASMFSGYDAEVSIIPDGKDGLEAARNQKPDLILLCVELPRMSGYSVCKKLKKDDDLKSIPLVIMSSEANEETFEQHKKLKTRANEYIIKPFDAEQLMAKIEPLIQLAKKNVDEGDDEFTLLDENEAISIEDEEAIAFEEGELASPEDELLSMEEPSELKNVDLSDQDQIHQQDSDEQQLNEVLEDLEIDSKKATQTTSSVGTDDNDAIEGLENVLNSIRSDEKEQPSSQPGDESDMDIDGLSLEGLDDDAKPEEPKVSGVEPDSSEQEILEDLEPSQPSQPPHPSIETQAAPAVDPSIAAKLKSVAAENRTLRERITYLESSADEARSTPDSLLTSKLKNTEEEANLFREKVSKLEARIEEMHATFKKRESELGSLRSKSTSSDKESLGLKSEINARERDILNFKEEINRKDQEILDIQMQVGEREKEIASLQEMVANRDREIKEHSAQFDTLLRQKNELEQQHRKSMADWEDRYTQETAELEHTMQVQREENAAAVEELNQKIATGDAQLKQLKNEMDDLKTRHSDEVFGLRTRYKNEFDKLQTEMNSIRSQLEDFQKKYNEEFNAHEITRQEAIRVPELVKDLEEHRETIEDLQTQVINLKNEITTYEDRVVKAYQKIKSDEKIKEKARKAVEIAQSLLANQIGEDTQEQASSPGDQPNSTV
jgi:Response regulators consisting of a CheY-like receiver domain and a winged-helix DNA-binding domain